MGEVWFGYDKRLDRPIAIKFIRVDRLADGRPDDELTRRFVRESRITASLEHPGVPAVYDCGTDGDDLYLVMQLVRGAPLNDLLDEVEEIPVGWAAAVAAQVCSVLAVAHANSLVHRDLKPANLMLCPDGTVKVLDFGVAAALSPSVTRLTVTGVVVGTAEYMAPEQTMSGTTSPQTDLYALGVILHELLAGRNQFAAETPLASMRRHVDEPPVPVRTLRPGVPEGLERLILWLLAKKPEDRPSGAALVYERLLPFCRELPPLPGFVDGGAAQPVRMYAAVVGRVATANAAPQVTGNAVREPVATGSAAPVPRPSVPQTPASYGSAQQGSGHWPPGGYDVGRVRRDAGALKGESRYRQAAELLAEAVQSVEPGGDEGLELRIELADVLFLGGDYRRAAPEFRRLAADLAERRGEDDHLVLRFRLMEANCHAALGDTALALEQMRLLLRDERRLRVDEDRILELRRRIGLLELGAGERVRAGRTLGDLLPDLERRYGAEHPAVGKVRELLDGLAAAR
ncbi:serine/threonine protein kinase [Microbispora cellulosiformans]|uniref:non-specific serine/threonine protein kinase n=2 Tax=Microbispora cellulosiformans TaxID=2614688 RepID=A0A5J5JZD0_9ACTN|nr:serine/threonine protein kinase [Microbispora cellulosiformans]